MHRLFLFVTALLLVVAACGGESGNTETDVGGDQPDTTQVETTEPTENDEGGSDETTPPPDDDQGEDDTGGDDSEGSGPSFATVTLGGETYAFSTEGAVAAQCLTDLFGIFSIQLPEVDGPGSVAIVALREGTDPDVVGEVNSVRLDVEDELWIADEADDIITQAEQFEPGMSQVDSIEIDGRTVRGTATFLRQGSLFVEGEPETMSGTFEATCGEERTS